MTDQASDRTHGWTRIVEKFPELASEPGRFRSVHASELWLLKLLETVVNCGGQNLKSNGNLCPATKLHILLLKIRNSMKVYKYRQLRTKPDVKS
jgi:hypothetical protein